MECPQIDRSAYVFVCVCVCMYDTCDFLCNVKVINTDLKCG